MTLVLFDFDGTITTKDSLIDFVKFAVGKPKFYIGLFLLFPILLGYKLKIIPNFMAKEKFTIYFFNKWDSLHFQEIADKYSEAKINEIIRPKAIEKIKWHIEQGHEVVIVSASMESWLKRWCQKMKIALIGTQLEIRESRLTGKFATKNCYGKEKVNRIKERFNLSEYIDIYAYGDSLGDKEMLRIANKPHYKFFH